MKEWEKELQLYRLAPAPPKENDLQKYILYYLSEKDDKYISWFLYYYERTLNEKAMAVVQDYAMYGHFADIKQAYIMGMLKALRDYDPSRGVPFLYIRNMQLCVRYTNISVPCGRALPFRAMMSIYG